MDHEGNTLREGMSLIKETRMNRRELLKWGALAGSPFLFSAATLLSTENELESSGSASGIQEIGLTNATHTDFGYTDLPSTTWAMQEDYFYEVLDCCRQTESYPEDSRFKWTVESLWPLERFLAGASSETRQAFDHFVENGQIEVTAMPGNMTCLVGRDEWEKELDRLAFLYKTYQPTVAVQNDVNGLPWGIIESLYARGIQRLSMGVNGLRTPVPRCSFFYWQTRNDNEKLLVWNGLHYSFGYNYFHEKEWRQGIPPYDSIWFNKPGPEEIFSSRPDDVRHAHELLVKNIALLPPDVQKQTRIMLPATNQRTIDNDGPCRQMSDFIRVWNDLGLTPRLKFITPGEFFNTWDAEPHTAPPVLRGDWSDWWGSGVASTPVELGLLQTTRRRAADIGRAKEMFSSSLPFLKERESQLNHDLVFAEEHTWGAYDSVDRIYREGVRGGLIEKIIPFYRASETSRKIQRDLLAARPDARTFSRSRCFQVINPGRDVRSGWVQIPNQAFRFDADSVREVATGETFPLIRLMLEEDPVAGAGGMEFRQFPVYRLDPGTVKKYEFIQTSVPQSTRRESRWFQPEFDSENTIKNIIYKPTGQKLFENSEFYPAQLISERQGEGRSIRGRFFDHRLEAGDVVQSGATVGPVHTVDNPYVLEYRCEQTDPLARRIEQIWRLHDFIPRIELETTVWLNEIREPVAASLVFPFAVQNPRCYYDSMGITTEVGRDQLPDSCAESHTVLNGPRFEGADWHVTLTSFHAPLGIFESIQRVGPRLPFVPKNAHYFSLFLETFWPTNFDIVHPCRITLKYIIEVGPTGTPLPTVENDELWAAPCV